MVNRDWQAIKNKETKESPSSRGAFFATLALPAVRTRIGRPWAERSERAREKGCALAWGI